MIPERFCYMKVTDVWVKFAAQNLHPDLCRILEGAGADSSALTHRAE